MTAKSQDYEFMSLDLIQKAESLRAQDTPMKIFDWDKAARIIAERKPEIAEAGLAGDWDYTGGVIYCNGEIVTSSYLYLGSMWATPTLIVDNDEVDCYLMESDTEWDSKTVWPDSAKEILNGANQTSV
jgi:hypothetical protein